MVAFLFRLYSSNIEIVTFRVSTSLKLVEVCLENLSFLKDIELNCLAIKLLFSSIQQWQNSTIESQTEDPNKPQERETLKKDCIRQLWKKLRSKLVEVLEIQMPDDYRSEALSRELKVRLKETNGIQDLKITGDTKMSTFIIRTHFVVSLTRYVH